jgi:cell division protein FtsZ
LEAAERAIANPLLDGVSMQGAKGVIISITGGDDMRLMEVDEAANHIRELVDPDANIIWGSAFNENLNGKIRVSVVATGIDHDGSAPAQAPRSFSFDQMARPAPVMAASSVAAVAAPVAEAAAAEPEEVPASENGEEPTGYQPYTASYADKAEEAAADDNLASDEADAADQGGALDESADDALVLGAADAAEEGDGGDDLLELGAAHVAEDSSPVTGLANEDISDLPPEPSAPPPRVSTGGGTLFERMTNLSRGLARSEDDDDDNDNSAPGLNIPRFLDRQSNN